MAKGPTTTRGLRFGACRIRCYRKRAQIDVAIAEHRATKGMAARFGISRDSIYRHRRRHLTSAMLAKLASGSAYTVENLTELKSRESERLLSNAVEIRRRLYENAEAAERAGDHKAATSSYAVILKSLELMGKLLDQFKGHERTTVNQLIISPDYLRLRAALIGVLAPYPELTCRRHSAARSRRASKPHQSRRLRAMALARCLAEHSTPPA